jgi:hypothetical protein
MYWLDLAQWAVNGTAILVVGITKWGMRQREKAEAAEKEVLNKRMEALETANKERNPTCAQHRQDLDGLRERMVKMEGFMEQTAGDFTRAMEQMGKMTARMTLISDRMLTKDDLQLIIQVQQGK